MAAWGTKQKTAGAPSRGQTNSLAAAWRPAGAGRSAVNQEEIAKRAYEKWLRGGCQHGQDQKDWFEAERELWTETGRSRN